ncbi:hypothetical protein [Moorena sp. SIO3I6]|nr:hypothetical protein [Moorena sp. SIO3I6]NEP21957.1 hypothetical protein [Moorena sp. SIO3I6]
MSYTASILVVRYRADYLNSGARDEKSEALLNLGMNRSRVGILPARK